MLSVDTGRRITDVCGLVRCFDLGVTAGSDSFAKTHECPRCRSGSCPMPPPVTHPHRPHYQQPPRHRLARTMAPAKRPNGYLQTAVSTLAGGEQRAFFQEPTCAIRCDHLTFRSLPKDWTELLGITISKPAAISLYRPMIVPEPSASPPGSRTLVLPHPSTRTTHR